MAYIDHDDNTVVLDAVLTKKGRELLSRGQRFFNITKFAVSDDEVDYDLWNPDHEDGTAYYGAAIENMPVLEANPNGILGLKHKLVSLNKEALYVAKILIPSLDTYGGNDVNLSWFEFRDAPIEITPETWPFEGEAAGYTILIDTPGVISVAGCNLSPAGSAQEWIDLQTKYAQGEGEGWTGMTKKWALKPLFSTVGESKSTKVTFTCRETGASLTLNITVTGPTQAELEQASIEAATEEAQAGTYGAAGETTSEESTGYGGGGPM